MSDEMGDLLSEDELDALLGDGERERASGATAGIRADAERVGAAIGLAPEPFDLTRPSWLGPARLRVVERLFVTVGERLGSLLATELRAPVQVRLASLEQARCDAVVETLPDPLIAFVLRQSGEGAGRTVLRWLLAFDLPAAFGMLDRLLGGPGDAQVPARGLTMLEQRLLEPIRDGVCALLVEGMRSLMPLELVAERSEASPWLARIADPHEPVLMAVFELGGELDGGRISVTAPIAALASELEDKAVVETDTADVAAADRRSERAPMRPALARVPLELAAVLGHGRITVRELLGLSVGDIVVLTRRAGDPLELRLGGRTKYEGTVGTVGGRYGFRVERRVAEPRGERR